MSGLLTSWFHRWLHEPAFCFQVFLLGLLPFLLGALPLWFWPDLPRWLKIVCWASMATGIAIALPGYVGIWRWRWKAFRQR